MKEKLINTGGIELVTAYFCTCGNCGFWEIDKDKVERIEKLHSKKVQILAEAREKLMAIQKREAEILGLEVIEVQSV